ncbi:MAG: cation diffusion facilitator family transporter [Deltaproteobacteria bacterium]|nr:cation diffusion facilitator family transporter [Deltaproteobacteria bacterium]
MGQSETNSPPISRHSVDQETALIKKIALFAFLLNLGLAAMKGILAFYSSSLAVTAGAIDSGTDAVASLILYGGLKLSTRKTASFPLGLYKIENLISVVIALFIFFAGYEIALQVIRSAPAGPDVSIHTVLLLSAGVLAIYLFGRYAIRIGRRTESPFLMGEARHRQVDVLSSIVVVASVVTGYFHWNYTFLGISTDQIAAAVVLIFIAWAGWELLVDGMRVLLDASLDFDTLALVRRIVENHPTVAEVSSLTGRSAGRFRFLQANVILRTDNLQKAHQVSENLESIIRENVPHVERVIIHYEPQSRTHIRIAVPLADASGTVSGHFGESPYFALITVRLSDQLVEKKDLVENPHKNVETAKGIRVAEWLVGQNIDQVMMKEDLSRKGPGYVLSTAGARSTLTAAENLDDAIAEALLAQKALLKAQGFERETAQTDL